MAARLLGYLAQLRGGHTPLLKAYANQLDTTVDPKCHSCREEPQTAEHWLQRRSNSNSLVNHAYRSQLLPPTLSPPSLRALGTISQQQQIIPFAPLTHHQ